MKTFILHCFSSHKIWTAVWKHSSTTQAPKWKRRYKSRAQDHQYPLGFTRTHTHTVTSGTLIQRIERRQRASLLVSSPASIHLTNLLENITHCERAAIVELCDKWTPTGMTHQYRKYKESLMHTLHLRANIICYIFASLCVW